jgi:indolepyruvate ferredoxin oxidoreductase beta subunit
MIKTQIILAGIGGQGILFAARIFSEMGLKLGADVLGSETHGMSQRGGSVLAHLKLGDFHSPLIRTGAADILYSFADEESYRSFKFLKSGGASILKFSPILRVRVSFLETLMQTERPLKWVLSGPPISCSSVIL